MSVILIHNFQLKKVASLNQLPILLELGFTKALAAFSSHAICRDKRRKAGGHRDGAVLGVPVLGCLYPSDLPEHPVAKSPGGASAT